MIVLCCTRVWYGITVIKINESTEKQQNLKKKEQKLSPDYSRLCLGSKSIRNIHSKTHTETRASEIKRTFQNIVIATIY